MHFIDFDRLTHLIYQGACDDHAFDRWLGALATAFRCTSAAFVYSDPMVPTADIQVTHGPFSDPGLRARYMTYADEDPAPGAMALLPIGTAASTDRLFSREYRAQSRFLHEFYRPLGFEEALGGPVVEGNGRIGIVAVHRGPERETFSDEEISDFGRLLSHVAKALAIRRTFFAALNQSAGVAEALDRATGGVLIFDRGGGLLHANMQARTVLRRNDGLHLTRMGTLRFTHSEADRRFRAIVAGPIRGQASSVLQVRRGPAAPPYVVRIVPLGNGKAHAGAWAVFVSDPELADGDVVGTLEAAFGVSRQAASLVAALMAGRDLASYAASAGISRNTAKFHLQAAFAATGLSRQSHLVRTAVQVVRDLGVIARD